jgi:beta-glucosidase
LYVGYRYYDLNPSQCRFPFGHGLSYTTFELSNLIISPPTGDDAGFEVSLDLVNTGDTAGGEVIQIYIRDVISSLPRPFKELKAFRKVFLAPGQKVTVEFSLDKRALGFWDDAREGSWVAEKGEFVVFAGTSSASVPLQKTIVLGQRLFWRGL